MENIGEFLKSKRLEKNLSIVDVSDALKVRKYYIEAIEKNDTKKFVSFSYYYGYLKQYLDFLGENINLDSTKQDIELTINMPISESTNPSFSAAVISTILLILVYSFCNFLIEKFFLNV